MKSLSNNFFGYTKLIILFCTIGYLLPSPSFAQEAKQVLIPALNAYSFSDLMEARDKRNNEQVYTLFNLLDWCATHHIAALDPTAYFFPGYPEVPADPYLDRFKAKAAELGIVISGTGIRNNFASPDPGVRAEGVALAKEWIVAASRIGAPVVRLFAGAVPEGYDWEEVAGWMVACYKECASFGAQYGVKIGIQNHGEMLQTAEQCLYVLREVDSPWAGLIVDTGNFRTEDPYKDIKTVAPYAVNWQIKESVFGIGSEIPTDFDRLATIIARSGYSGYLPVETLMVRGVSYDPFKQVPEMIGKLQAALQKTGY